MGHNSLSSWSSYANSCASKKNVELMQKQKRQENNFLVRKCHFKLALG